MSELCMNLIAFNAVFLGRNMGDLQMAVGCFGCILQSWNLLSNGAFRWKMKPFVREVWAHRPFLPSAQFLRKCATEDFESWQAFHFPLVIWEGLAAVDCTEGWEGNAPCSSSRFGLNQKRRTCVYLVIGSKRICWSDLVGKQLKQPVAPRSFKQKSKHHLSQNNSNVLNLVASAEVAMCEFPWTLANLWDLLINEKNKGPGPETFPYLGTRVSVLTRSPGLGSGLLLLEMSKKNNSKQFEKPT